MNKFINKCSAAILAGGENRRMPILKAFIEVEGQKIIERNLKIMKSIFSEIFIITNQPEAYSHLKTPLLGDIYDIRGPMTGIFTALLNSSNRWIFISACDMPFLSTKLIEYMASKRADYDAVVPESPISEGAQGGVEPLFAFYSKHLAASMEKAILSGNKSLRDFLNNKRVHYITSGEINKLDPDKKSFINLNTPEDIDLYLRTQDMLRFKKTAGRREKCLV